MLTQITTSYAEKVIITLVYKKTPIFPLKIGENDDHIRSTPWRRVMGVIALAYKSEDPGFESHQGVRFLGIYTLQCRCHN
jgi:hypothetical protein